MEFKSLALSALMGVSIAASPVLARPVVTHQPVVSHGHLAVTPIFCDDEGYGCLSETGAFSNYVANSAGHFIRFGMADANCYDTFVGARIDAAGFPAGNWAITLSATGDPFFRTEVVDRFGNTEIIDCTSSYVRNGNQVTATFNASDFDVSGERFVAIWIYDNGNDYGESFLDLLNVDHGVRVDGSFPVAVTRHLGISDCSGLFGNSNGSN